MVRLMYSRETLAKASLAAEYLRRVQRPGGLIDLRNCNY
jgi:hypothetical protein